MFFEAKKCPSKHHDLPAIHHNLTSKKPPSAPGFSQNPPQKHRITSQKNIPILKK
jgi:hypothetical protein